MTRRQRTINMALWVAQASLASALLFSGIIKISQPLADVATIWQWTLTYPAMVRVIGIIEIFLGLAVVIPELLRMKRPLTLWATIACTLWLIAFGIFLVTQQDFSSLGSMMILLLFTVFIVWGRQNPAYSTPR